MASAKDILSDPGLESMVTEWLRAKEAESEICARIERDGGAATPAMWLHRERVAEAAAKAHWRVQRALAGLVIAAATAPSRPRTP